ncbi:carboxypeptidase SOL1 [Selaginella moellendorffii]|uniref:carboxypeptidase SOL1 n=1 Tax=Selaginella moellendorffii TaxID=88036 RepID=UPI000D1C4268|nr:carboxypeptidase SOL1 [Selaginella moellendorffii]|eukprot:XP_024542018.1 carboxypeptidase SOL1 [Selaginella moellendorffii]
MVFFPIILAIAMALGAGAIREHGGSTAVSSGKFANKYLSNTELEDWLKDFSVRCGRIARLNSIGTSVQGRDLWVLELSDMPGQAEAEPGFKFVGNMHGDEPVGRELTIRLADWLCMNYKRDAMATSIIDNVHLHLLPSMNPDGFANRSRNNANNVDLNRDFPDQFFPQNNNEARRQPETLAVMKWLRQNNFVASASLHEGALVANYPWDGNADKSSKYTESPDDSTFRFLASVYSKAHRNMSKSHEFPGGITNGAAWYPLYGGMQDWNYIHARCLELTLEIYDTKWPPGSQIAQIWEENRQSMLELVSSTFKSGVHGKVFSSASGLPLAATIQVDGFNQTIKATSQFGNYHRLLPPGKAYKVTASMDGHRSRSVHVLSPNGESTALDFILDPIGGVGQQHKLMRLMTTHNDSDTMALLLYHSKFTFLSFLGVLVILFSCFGCKRRLWLRSEKSPAKV